MSLNRPPKFQKFKQFFTSIVTILILIGVFLIFVGQTSLGYEYLPGILTRESSIYPIIRSIGGALLGGGVFTAIIKSSEYTEVFTRVVEGIVGSKQFIEKRTDKKEFWNMVSRLMYEEKFPLISNQLQDIIANHYLPTSSEFYLENYDLFINITNIDNDFWKHHETMKFIIKPSNNASKICYKIKVNIDLPPISTTINDLTDFVIEEITINGQVQTFKFPNNQKSVTLLSNVLTLDLQNNDEYKIVVKRFKVMYKKTNLDKRFFAPYIINNMTITLIVPQIGTLIDFHKMGTVNDYVKEEDQVNNNTRILTWVYKGLILPHQGNILIFK